MNEKIDMVNLSQLQLSPKELMAILGISCILSYLIGLFVGIFL